jgi:hypothetical protein
MQALVLVRAGHSCCRALLPQALRLARPAAGMATAILARCCWSHSNPLQPGPKGAVPRPGCPP